VNIIKQTRLEKGISQKKLAELVGVSRETIAAYENGRCLPSIRVAIKLSEILDIPIEELLKEVTV